MSSKDFPPIFEDKLLALPDDIRENIANAAVSQKADKIDNHPVQGDFNVTHLSKIHERLFNDVSTYAGVVRKYGISKGDTAFADPMHIEYLFKKELPKRLESLKESVNDPKRYADATADLHSTLDLAHPFREGNGRATRIFMKQLAETHGYSLDFSKVSRKKWVDAARESVISANEEKKRAVFLKIVTPTRERVIDSALHNMSTNNTPENKARVLKLLESSGIKKDEIEKRTNLNRSNVQRQKTTRKAVSKELDR